MGTTDRAIAGIILYIFSIVLSGCINGGQTNLNIDEQATPAPTHIIYPVPPAPKQLFLYPDSTETFQFWNHSVKISYLSTSPQTVEVNIDGIAETIQIDRNSSCPGDQCGYYATVDEIDYSIKPVTWKYNEAGEKIWSFETWNTSELYFVARIKEINRSSQGRWE